MIPIVKKPQPLEATRWLSKAFLLSKEEMREMFSYLREKGFDDPSFFYLGKIASPDELKFSSEEFLDMYDAYVDSLQKGETASLARGALGMTVVKGDVVFQEFGVNKVMAVIEKPVIQVRPHRLLYSQEEKKFRSQQMGKGGISFGIEILFPQLYMDKDSSEIKRSDAQLSNFSVFKEIEKWLRSSTLPTPFKVEGVLHNVPSRIGKKTLGWIERHPDFEKEGVTLSL